MAFAQIRGVDVSQQDQMLRWKKPLALVLPLTFPLPHLADPAMMYPLRLSSVLLRKTGFGFAKIARDELM
jgi:hypothetical protein